MADIRFKTEWLTQIALLAHCGTPDQMTDLCNAIQLAAQGLPVDELSGLVAVLFNPIAEDIEQMSELKKKRANAGSEGGKQKVANGSKSVAKTKQNVAKDSKEKEEEREEDGEAERESEKENVPHTPLKEKDKEKGEEGEEEKEEEREISCFPAVDGVETCVIEADTLPSIIAEAIPAPLFVPEADPNRLTDRMLEDEFDALWLLYPRKSGKKDALRHYKAARKSGVAYDTIEDGIKRYAQHIRDEHTEEQYIAMGSTWFCGHRWEDKYARHGPKPGSMEWLAEIARGERQV